MDHERSEHCEECGTRVYQAGERVAGGTYLRVGDGSFQRLVVAQNGILPATFDGHVAHYRLAATPCACERRLRADAMADDIQEAR